MSARQISNETIVLLASWGSFAGTLCRTDDIETARVIAKALWEANSHSLYAKYKERSVGDYPRVERKALDAAKKASPVQVLRSARCLDYQSCEYAGWKQSQAHIHLQAIESRVCTILGIPDTHDLTERELEFRVPGYKYANWD